MERERYLLILTGSLNYITLCFIFGGGNSYSGGVFIAMICTRYAATASSLAT